jgi:hypothetical protein
MFAEGEMIKNVPMSHQYHAFHNPPPATPADVRTALESDDVGDTLKCHGGVRYTATATGESRKIST